MTKLFSLARCALALSIGLALIGCKSNKCGSSSGCPSCQSGTSWSESPTQFYSADGQPLHAIPMDQDPSGGGHFHSGSHGHAIEGAQTYSQ